MEISNLSDAEFKKLDSKDALIRMLKELSEDLNSIKQIRSEMKNSLSEIKNNLQGNNSRVDEAKNQSNDLEHQEEKTTIQNNKKKKESKKMRLV